MPDKPRPLRANERRARKEPAAGEKLGFTSVESLLCAGLALGLFVTSLDAYAFGGSASYRTLGLAISGCIIGSTLVLGLTPRAGARQRTGRDRDALVLLAALYFGWRGAQDYFLQSDLYGAVQSLIALLVVYGALAADLERLNTGLRRWLLVVVAAFLIPALTDQGFEAGGRVWLDFLPGRYFGWSNPDALAFLAGLAVLLALPVLRQRRGRMLATLATILLVVTAGNTTATAVGLAFLGYLALSKVKSAGLLKFTVGAFAFLTPALLLWLPSDNAIRFLVDLQTRFDLSGRSLLWAHLVRLTRNSDSFWTGLGDQKVAFYTTSILDVYSAHSTILQVFMSGGFFTAVLFVVVAAVATIRILNAWVSERTVDARIAFAVVVYWFVVGLTSAQPGTGIAFSVVIALAVAASRTRQPVEQIETPGRRQPLKRPPPAVGRHDRPQLVGPPP